MKNRLAVTLALTSILSFGGMALAKTPTKGSPLGGTTPATTNGSATNRSSDKLRKVSHRRHRRIRKHRKQVASASKVNQQAGARR